MDIIYRLLLLQRDRLLKVMNIQMEYLSIDLEVGVVLPTITCIPIMVQRVHLQATVIADRVYYGRTRVNHRNYIQLLIP